MPKKDASTHIKKSSASSKSRYTLLYTEKAVRDIRKLDKVAQKKLKKTLEKLRQNPVQHSKKLSDKKLGDRRFRVGDHRIIFDLEGNKIIILRVGRRDEIYK